MLHSIEQTDPDLAAVFSRKYTGTTEHRLHYESAYTKISAAAAIDPVLRSVLADICTMTQVPSSLPTWTTGTCGSHRTVHWIFLLSSQQPPDQSTLSHSPPRFRCGEHLAKTPSLMNCTTRSNSHSVVPEDTSKSMVTLSPALLFWANKPPWKNQTTLPANRHHACRPQCGRAQRADSA